MGKLIDFQLNVDSIVLKNLLTKLDTGAAAVESLFTKAPFGSARYLLFLKFN